MLQRGDYMCHSTCVAVQRQISGVCSLLLPCTFWGLTLTLLIWYLYLRSHLTSPQGQSLVTEEWSVKDWRG